MRLGRPGGLEPRAARLGPASTSLDPERVFSWVGSVNDPVASVARVVRYSNNYAILGLYIVEPSLLRGLGLGRALWSAAHGPCGGLRGWALMAWPKQEDNYRRGPDLSWPGTTLRSQGRGREGSVVQDRRVVSLSVATVRSNWPPMTTPFQPVPRPAFLQAWNRDASKPCTGLVGKRRTAGLWCACGPVWRATSWRRCAPTHPPSPRPLFEALVRTGAFGAEPVFVDVHPGATRRPMNSPGAKAWKPPFPTARMYRGPAPRNSRCRASMA